MTPRRIQRKRTKGWRMPKNAVYVGRRSKWANRYRVVREYGEWLVCRLGVFVSHHRTRAEAQAAAVARWEKYIWPRLREAARRELPGKHLCCWCWIGDPCHGDIMLKEING